MYALFGYKNSGSAAMEICLKMAGIRNGRVEEASLRASSRVDDLGGHNPPASGPHAADAR